MVVAFVSVGPARVPFPVWPGRSKAKRPRGRSPARPERTRPFPVPFRQKKQFARGLFDLNRRGITTLIFRVM